MKNEQKLERYNPIHIVPCTYGEWLARYWDKVPILGDYTDPILFWAICEVSMVTYSTKSGQELYREKLENQIVGFVVSDSGLIPADETSNFAGYIHKTQSIEDFLNKIGFGPRVDESVTGDK
jgi:hypothetical protein